MNPVLVNVMFCPKGTTSEEKIEKRWKKPNWTQGTCRSLWSSINNQIFWFLFHMTQAMFFWYCRRRRGFISCSKTSSIRDNQTSTAVPRPHDTFPPSSLRGTLPTCPIHIPIPSFFLSFFYSLHQTRSCKTYIPSVSHHFQSQIHCSLPHHMHYFISWPSLHVLIKGHNLFNSPLPFVQKTL